MGGAPGGYGGGGGGGAGGGGAGYNAGGLGGGPRQLYVNNVCCSRSPACCHHKVSLSTLTPRSQLPFTVGWQDLKDLFRQAGKKNKTACPATFSSLPFAPFPSC